jgi:hypothetical protein
LGRYLKGASNQEDIQRVPISADFQKGVRDYENIQIWYQIGRSSKEVPISEDFQKRYQIRKLLKGGTKFGRYLKVVSN